MNSIHKPCFIVATPGRSSIGRTNGERDTEKRPRIKIPSWFLFSPVPRLPPAPIGREFIRSDGGTRPSIEDRGRPCLRGKSLRAVPQAAAFPLGRRIKRKMWFRLASLYLRTPYANGPQFAPVLRLLPPPFYNGRLSFLPQPLPCPSPLGETYSFCPRSQRFIRHRIFRVFNFHPRLLGTASPDSGLGNL